jgi:ABC-type tungstate transport system permease subunit
MIFITCDVSANSVAAIAKVTLIRLCLGRQDLARRFAQWLLSPEGQAAIGEYKVHGEQLFHPSASNPK